MKYQLQPDYWLHYNRFQFILKYVREYKDPSVLDLGCGTGILVAFPLAELGYDVTGVDIDPRSIAVAEKENPFPNLTFFCSDFTEYFPEKKFDVIIAAEIIEHLDDPESLLLAIKRMLNPGGTVIISAPNGYGPHEVEAFFFHTLFEPWGFVPKIRYFNRSITAIKLWVLGRGLTWPDRDPVNTKPEMTVNLECGHHVRITEPWFRQMCQNTGFDIVESKGAGMLHGQISGHTVGNFSFFNTLNAGISEMLPLWMAGRWFFTLRRSDESPS